MLQVRRPIGSTIGVLALAAVLVPASATAQGSAAHGSAIRVQMIRAATPPTGGPVTLQELPGCSNPSELFAGASQGCVNLLLQRDDTPLHPLYSARGPRQTTSLDGSFNPETGALSLVTGRAVR